MSAAETLRSIAADIEAFDKQSEADEHTDVGSVWDLLASISERCEREQKNIIDAEGGC